MTIIEERRVSLVTGGTDGIGRAVALELARRGDRVLFVGRDHLRGEEVLASLRELSPDAAHAFLPADLALLTETARVAAVVEAATPRLDAIVCCAGILSTLPEWTEEGLERNLVLNYLSRFLLVQRLLPLVSDGTAERPQSGRIVLVSNAGRYADTLDFEDLQHRRGRPGLAVAGRTQFANDLLAIELAERLRHTRVAVTCVFPGITRSSCFRNARGLPFAFRMAIPLVLLIGGRSPEAAARTPVFLAQDPDTDRGGRFFGPDCREIPVPARARDERRRSALWTASEALVRPYLHAPDRPERAPSLRPETGLNIT
jgi:NAD(P)-dependent dehydrogenase (short-subunit alcohol dehydrogenase family)